jgi:hypothetical protein
MHAVARRAPVAFALLCSLSTVPVASAVCPGDCNGDGTVVVSEIITGVNIALGTVDISACRAFDLNNDNMVSVNEIISAVGSVLNGCPTTPTPTAVPIEPIFPANYRDTFAEVRDCRLGIEHGGVMIRVLANSTGFQPYLGLGDPLPVGTIVVKEEYSGTDCDLTKLVSWSAMRKEAPGFDPVDGDWQWQRIPAPGSTVPTCLRKDDCPGFTCTSSGCHRLPDCLARDYMCTADVRGKLYPVMQDLSGALLSISGTAPNDVYAVGADAHDGKGPSVLHYDGSTWSRLDSGIGSGSLWWISITPVEGDFYMAGDKGVILQFDPSSGKFTRAATPDNTVQLYGIWGTAANDLWAVGTDKDGSKAVVWHFDGMMWSAQDVSNVVPSDEPNGLNKVWGTSATDVYAVGQTGLIIHYDGQKWSRITGVPATNLFTVHGNGSVLVAVGGFVQSGVILEQSGGSFADRAPSGAPQMNGVFVSPNGNVVTVGVGLSVATGDSSGWRLIDEGTDRKNRDFHGTWVDSADGIWAVGGDLGNMNNGIVSYGRSQ